MAAPIDAALEASRPRRGRLVQLVAGLLISLLFIYALLSRVPLAQVGAALARARPPLVFAALGGIALSYGLRTQRWAMMLRSLGAEVSFAQAATPLMGCVALNNVLPLRAGDVVRILAFRRLTKVGPSMQLGSLVLERLLDMATLMAILFAVLAFHAVAGLQPRVREGLEGAALVAVVAIAGFLAAPAPLRLVVRAVEGRAPRLRAAGESLLRLSEAITALSRPSLLARLTGVSGLAWLCEGSAYVCIALALGVAHAAPAGLLALGLGTLATTIPSSPGYVGTFHYFAALALVQTGAAPALAAAFAILIHAVLWVSTTAVGFLLMLTAGRDAWRAPAVPPAAAAPEPGSLS